MSTIVTYKTPEPADAAPLTLIYLAGPITGVDDYRENFAEAAALLGKHGFVVVNPASLDLGDQATWQDYMRATTRLLTACAGVALLPGWEASRGARVEAMWAAAVGVPVATLGQWVYNEPDITPSLIIDWGSVPSVDILAGGSPCQDLSTAGRRTGMTDGTRSNLWVSMREAIAQLRPDYVIWENVRGAYSAPADSSVEPCSGCVGDRAGQPVLRALGRVLGDLASLGYDAAWCGLRASDIGAPHQRFRVFIVAHPSGVRWQQRRPAAAQQTPSIQEDCAPSRHHRIRPAVALLPTPRSATGASATETLALLPTPVSRDVKGYNQRHDTSCLLGAVDPADYKFGGYHPAISQWASVLGRPAPEPTEIGPRGGTRLSAQFVEWMMGLPEGWVTASEIGLTRSQQLRILGNGVVPQQAFAAITRLTDMIQGNHYD